MFVIYKISNHVNHKIYIGCSSKSVEERFRFHFRQRKRNKTVLARAINKHGFDKFYVELIEICSTKEKMLEREIYWIAHYESNNRSNGYNMTIGGDGGPY
jgi:group I intron endonuclease